MELAEQIKQIRKERGLTQEALAQELHVTRQAVSSWENGKTIPDLGLIIQMSQLFSISLDQLILGGESMNQTTKHLIEQGSLGKRARNLKVYGLTGGLILLMGVLCLVLKAMIPVTIDANGVLQEPFFLVPVGYLLILMGCLVIGFSLFLAGLSHMKQMKK